MQNFQSICRMCTIKLVAKYPKYNMQATCANVVHVLWMCGNSEKKTTLVSLYAECLHLQDVHK